MTITPTSVRGQLAWRYCEIALPVQVLKSGNGFYLGTADNQGPCSRESEEYWPDSQSAEAALASGQWTQRQHF